MTLSSLDRNHSTVQDDTLGDGNVELSSDSEVDRDCDSAAPSNVQALSITLEKEYAHIARKLLLSRIKDTYPVLFPFWICDCTLVPREFGLRRPHPSQYYSLPCQQQEWKQWQRANPGETDPGGVISLNAIEWHSLDAHDMPPFHLWYLILAAIHGSPMKRLTENEIKLCLIRRFAYFAFRQNNGPDDADDADETDEADAWVNDVPTELRNNSHFTKSDVIKQDRDDSNHYWIISQLPLDIAVFHYQRQLIPSKLNSQGSVRTRRHRPTPLETLRQITNTDTSDSNDHTSSIRPKIPISMLIHSENIDPITVSNKPFVIAGEMMDNWTWLWRKVSYK